MNRHFPSWLLLYYNASTADERRRGLLRLFRHHNLNIEHFKSDVDLYHFMRDLCRFSSIRFQRTVGIKPEDDYQHNVDRYKPSTVAYYARCIRDYQVFLYPNKSFSRTIELLQRIEHSSRHTEQSGYLISLVLPGYWVKLFHRCVDQLKNVQIQVDKHLVYRLSTAPVRPKKKEFTLVRAFLHVAYMLYHRPVLHTAKFKYIPTHSGQPMTEQELHLHLENPKHLPKFFDVQEKHLDTTCTRLYVTAERKFLTCHIVKSSDKRQDTFKVVTYTMIPTLGFYFVLFGSVLYNIDRKINSPFLISHRMANMWRLIIRDTDGLLRRELDLSTDKAKRFSQKLKTMFLTVHTNFNIIESTTETLTQTDRLQYIGHLAELGFVTSSERSEYYKGMSRINDIRHATQWWSTIHKLTHPTVNMEVNSEFSLQVIDFNHKSLKDLFESWMIPYRAWTKVFDKHGREVKNIDAYIARHG